MSPETWDGEAKPEQPESSSPQGHEPGDVAEDVTWVPICEKCGGSVNYEDGTKRWEHY